MSGDDDRHRRLVEELQNLRKGDGLTLAKLSQARLVVAALTDVRSPQEALARLVVELDALGEGGKASAVRNALNIDKKPGNLSQRREDLATSTGKHADTIESYENQGFKELSHRLLDPKQEDRPPPELERPVRYVIERIERISVYRGCRLREVNTTRQVRAQVDGFDRVTSRFRHGANPSGVSIQAIYGCTIEESHLSPSGVLISQIRLSETLRRGQTHKYMTRMTVDADEPSEPWLIFGAAHVARHQRVILGFQFDPAALPTSIWWLENVSYMAAPGKPDGSNLLTITAGGSVEKEFRNLEPGRVQVVGWEWPEE